MAGRTKKMVKDTRTGATYESMYAAGKVIGPAEYAEGSAKNPAGKIKQDQHVWFAIARDKDNVGRFEISEDGGTTWTPFVFTPSKRKPAAERKAAAAAKASANGNGTSAPANESKEERIARLRAELAATETEAPAGAVVEEEEAKPTPGSKATAKLAGTMKVQKS